MRVEHRKHPRFSGSWEALWVDDRRNVGIEVVDLSLSGCRIKHDGSLLIGSVGRIVFGVPNPLSWVSDKHQFLPIMAEVLRSGDGEYFVIEQYSAVRFIGLAIKESGIPLLVETAASKREAERLKDLDIQSRREHG